jgi:hypothetical protein
MTATAVANGSVLPGANPTRAKRSSTKRTQTTKRVQAKATAKTRQVADRAAAAAKAGGAIGKGDRGELDRHQRALRDTAIMARVAEGRTSAAIGEEFDISARSVEAVKAKWREGVAPLDRPPMEVVEWLAEMHLRQFGDLAAQAAACAGRNESVSLGAKKAAGDALVRYTELMCAVGLLPENLSLFRSERALRRLADELMLVMERVEAGEMNAAEAGAFFKSLVSDAPATQLPAAV